MTTVLGILLGVLVVLVITALTGYFVAQEFGYMAVDRSRLQARAAAGDAGARARPGHHRAHLVHAVGRAAGDHRHRAARRLRRRAADRRRDRRAARRRRGARPGSASRSARCSRCCSPRSCRWCSASCSRRTSPSPGPSRWPARWPCPPAIYLTAVRLADPVVRRRRRTCCCGRCASSRCTTWSTPRPRATWKRSSTSPGDSGDLPAELSTLLDRVLDFTDRHRPGRDDPPRRGWRRWRPTTPSPSWSS